MYSLEDYYQGILEYVILNPEDLNLKEEMSPLAYCREFKTVALQIPRQRGNTRTIEVVSRKLWKKPLWVFPVHQMRNNLQFPTESDSMSLSRLNVIARETPQTLVDYDCVIVDPASLVRRESINNVYESLYPNVLKYPKFFFLLIG